MGPPIPSPGPTAETRPESPTGGRTTWTRVDSLHARRPGSGRLNETVSPVSPTNVL